MKKFVQVAASVGIRESWYPNQLSILYQQLKFIQDDDRFHWIHTKTKNQLIEQTIIHKNKRYRVDCASVDHVQKACWIIDFKTYHVSALLQTGKADTPPKIPVSYWRQLRGYAECFQALFPDYQIQAGLYYPLACFWAQCPEHDDNSATKSPLL